MKKKFYTLALVLGMSPVFALSQQTVPNGTTPPTFPGQQQSTDRDRGMPPTMDRDDQVGVRPDRDDMRNSQVSNADLQNLLRQKFPNSNIAVNFQNDNTVVLTGNVPTKEDRENAEQLVRSELGGVRVVDQMTVNGVAPDAYPTGAYPNADRDRDRDNDRDRDDRAYPQQQTTDRDRDQNVDRDRDNRLPQSDVDAKADRDQNTDKDRDKDHGKKHKKDKDKDKNKNKDKDKDRDRDQDRANPPH